MKAMWAVVVGAGFLLSQLEAQAASYNHWRKELLSAREARKQRDFEKARTILEGAAAEAAQVGPEPAAENSNDLSIVLYDAQRYQESISVLDAALEKIGPNPVANKMQAWRGILLHNKSRAHLANRQNAEARASAEEARTVLQNVGGKFNPELYRLNALLGSIYEEEKNYPEAEKAFKSALKLSESDVVFTDSEWSGAESSVGMYRIQSSKEGPLRMSTALGDLYLEQDKLKEAEEYFRKALKIAESAYGKKSQAIALPLQGLARIDLKEGRRKEFENDVQRIFEVASKDPGFKLWVTSPLWLKFETEFDEGNPEAASRTAGMIAKVYAAQRFEPQYMAKHALAYAHKGKADWEKAERISQILGAAAEVQFASETFKLGPMYSEFATFAERFKRNELARRNYEAVARTQENAPDKSQLVGALAKLAEMNIAENKLAEALPMYQRITALVQAKFGDDSRTANAMEKEADLLKQLGKDQEAAEVVAKASEVRKRGILKR